MKVMLEKIVLIMHVSKLYPIYSSKEKKKKSSRRKRFEGRKLEIR